MRRTPNAFWRFSLSVYRRPGVEAALIALQDGAGTDTNLLLWCCWQAGRGHALDKRTLRRAMAATARWQSEVILPLRRARRSLEAAPQGLTAARAEDLRRRIGAAELDMEHAEQRALYDMARSLPPRRRAVASRDAARASIARYLGLLGNVVTEGLTRHVDTLIAACVASGSVESSIKPAPRRG